jgi:hypothetical protein
MCYFLKTIVNQLKAAMALSADITPSPAGKKRGFCLLHFNLSSGISEDD